MQVKRSKNLLAILAVAVAVALPTTAFAADPTITLKVNGADITAFQGSADVPLTSSKDHYRWAYARRLAIWRAVRAIACQSIIVRR